MKKIYILQYEKSESGLNALYVADPDIKLDNGNIKILTTFIGSGADQLIKELTVSEERYQGRWIRKKLDKSHYKYICKKCGYSERFRAPKYCANCGQKMIIDDKEI